MRAFIRRYGVHNLAGGTRNPRVNDGAPGDAMQQFWTCNGSRPPNEAHDQDAPSDEFQGVTENKSQANHRDEYSFKIQIGAFSITCNQKSNEK